MIFLRKEGMLKMKLVIHDLDNQTEQKFLRLGKDTKVIRINENIKKCAGCFGCWVKTPGKCIIHDNYDDVGAQIFSCDKIYIISKNMYGSFSPFVRNIIDRSLSYLLPYFGIYNGEMHHKPRNKNHKLSMVVYFYGDGITLNEKETAKRLVMANAVNLHADVEQIAFLREPVQLSEVII